MVALVRHMAECSRQGFGHSDEAKRLSDGINQKYADYGPAAAGKYIAARLDNGLCRRELYDTKRDAVRDQSDEFKCLYLRLPLGGQMTACEAETLIRFHRQAYDNGFRLADPDRRDGGRSHILPNNIRGMNQAIRNLKRR